MKLFIPLCVSLLCTIAAQAQNVGIGTTTPQTKLHFVSTVGNNSGASQSVLIENTSTATGEASISFRNAGSVGTGAKAWFTGLNQNRHFSWTYGTAFLGADTKMLLDSTGRLGIGTIVPNEKLEIIGNIKADTIKPAALKLSPDAGMGKVLVSDAAGNASWQSGSSIGSGGVGFGAWGDCATNANISEYQPVADDEAATDDYFGTDVSISGNYAIVGAYRDDGIAGTDQGSASIYQQSGSGWVLMQKLTDATGALGDRFGSSVSISGSYAIVGASEDNGIAGSNQGSASIYQLSGGNWVLMQKLTDADGTANDEFGRSVSISGNYAIVGAAKDDGIAGTDQGSVSIYELSGGSWVLMQKLTDATGAAQDFFGFSVSISGNYAIVGAHRDDGLAGANQGSASIYQLSGGTWVLTQKLTDATGAADDLFGNSVSVSGNYAIIGAYEDDIGAVADQGSASIYQLSSGSWILMQKLTDATGIAFEFFGNSVSISGNYAVVGAYSDDGIAGVNQGSATIYTRVGLGWQKVQYVTDPAGIANNQFGGATAIDGSTQRFLIGVPEYANASGKVVFGKIN